MTSQIECLVRGDLLLSYTLRRIGQLIPVLFGMTIIVFAIIHAIPGDPAQVILGEKANAVSIHNLRQQLGLDEPLYLQYIHYIEQLFQGNLGTSLLTQKSITKE